jgi:antitoxin component YwqK of YwqJK toxin-antitoxin module
MKKFFSILTLCLVFTSCSPDRVLSSELTNNGDQDKPLLHFEGKLYSGTVYNVHSNGRLEYEENYKYGTKDGLSKCWYDNGNLQMTGNYENGQKNG